MSVGDAIGGSVRRLAEELDEDGIRIPGVDAVVALVVEELDHARRVPLFEGRRPLYGSMVVGDRPLDAGTADLDLLDLPGDLAAGRWFADGRSSYVVRHPDGRIQLACFDRSVQYEADLVALQEATGANIVQRTPVFGVVRVFADGVVVSWDGSRWRCRPTASALLPAVCARAPELDGEVARGLLDLAVHWLSPSRVGASFVVQPPEASREALDKRAATKVPALSITNRRHFPALLAALQQHDLATVVHADGRVAAIGVALRTSADADAAVPVDGGMRHRSAQRYSYDHPASTVVVVSEDGPVTVYRGGRSVATAEP